MMGMISDIITEIIFYSIGKMMHMMTRDQMKCSVTESGNQHFFFNDI
jgi:hypothetical protein